MATKVLSCLEEEVVWRRGTDPNYPYEAEVDGEKCIIRLNDFPDENLYTLVVGDVEVASFDDWPERWIKPGE